MIKNLIDAELSKENEDLAILKVNEIGSLFPFGVDLSPDERRILPKMGRKGLDFVERSLMYAREHPDLVSTFMDVDGMARDLTLQKQMQRVLSVLEPLCEKIRDTYLVVGAEAYANARVFYRTVKNAAQSGKEGCDFIAKDLGYHYKKQFSNSEKKEEENAANTTENGKPGNKK